MIGNDIEETQLDKASRQKTQEAVTSGTSALRSYQDLIVGNRSILSLMYFEWSLIVGSLPGALGLLMRKVFWPRLFSSCGSGVVFGARVTIRQPHRISIGDRCVVSDGCILEARSDDHDVLTIGADSILSNNVMISCKDGKVAIGEKVGIGAQTIIHAVAGASVLIGSDVLIGPGCYFAGGGNYHIDRVDIPFSEQGLRAQEGVKLGNNIWLGANVSVMSEVSIHDGCVVAAGSVVTKSLEENVIAMGVPATVVKSRREKHS